jgi:hypothetical protein
MELNAVKHVARGLLAGLLAAAACAQAAEPIAATQPTVLSQLSRETQDLYAGAQRGVVRLQLPVPRWINEMAADDSPLEKWGAQLADQMKQQLEVERDNVRRGSYSAVRARFNPTTGPASAWQSSQDASNNTVILESRGGVGTIRIQTGGELRDGKIASPGTPVATIRAEGSFAANNVGVICDDARHVLVPLYLEKEAIGSGVPASVAGHPIMTATFVASDKQTNVTVLQLPAGVGQALKLAASEPSAGSMVLVVSSGGDQSRLLLWTPGQRDLAGVVVNVDRSVAGFARYGQFLNASVCVPVVEQLVKEGRVKRAVLGIAVREVSSTDPVRDVTPKLGQKPALRVEDVRRGSAAAEAGIQRGDLILSIAGLTVGDPAGFAAAIANKSGKTPLTILRSGEVIELSVELKPQ